LLQSEIRKSLRQERKQIADPPEGQLRVRKKIQAAHPPTETNDLDHSEQGSDWILLRSLSRLQNASPSILPTTKSNLPLRKTGVRASLLTIITLATIIGSTILVSLSMLWNDGLYASWSQTLLLFFQAGCSTSLFDGSQKSAKLTRLPIHFGICVGFGAICALTSSAIYWYYETSATFFSFLANVGQAASAIVIARNINDSSWKNGSEDDALRVHREI
jgi:peptidoglycan/LPS O-acetylase OafA/YrhL